MNRLCVICLRYLDDSGEELTIGGVQTYISNLANLAIEIGLKTVVFQPSCKEFLRDFDWGCVIGIKIDQSSTLIAKKKTLYRECRNQMNYENDILLFALERLAVKTDMRSLAIQHGISWDIESSEPCGRICNTVYIFRRAYRSIGLINDASNVDKLICVDYNYMNWFRTQIKHRNIQYQIIPNFTHLPNFSATKKDDGIIRIIFARRFESFRGTRLFATVMMRILKVRKNIDITIAGEGPDEEYLRKYFGDEKCVHILKYQSSDSLLIHSDKDIAVIPTLGSEGTSLSLLEAMASHCAVVCTNVGGLTNVVVDRFNGLIVNPEETSLYNAIEELIVERDFRIKLARNGFNTVNEGFSYELWKKSWKHVLLESLNKAKD